MGRSGPSAVPFFAYLWSLDALSQFPDTSEDDLIRSGLIPQKTQDGHVKKRGLDGGFSHVASQFPHRFLLKSPFRFLGWRPVRVPSLLRAARAVAGLEVWVQAPEECRSPGSRAAPVVSAQRPKPPIRGRPQDRKAATSFECPESSPPAPVGSPHPLPTWNLARRPVHLGLPHMYEPRSSGGAGGPSAVGGPTLVPAPGSQGQLREVLGPWALRSQIANAAAGKETGARGWLWGRNVSAGQSRPCAELELLPQRKHAKVRSRPLPPPSGPRSTRGKRGRLGWAGVQLRLAGCLLLDRHQGAICPCPVAVAPPSRVRIPPLD